MSLLLLLPSVSGGGGGGGGSHNPNTKLLLKFNEGNGSTATYDTSQAGRYVTITGGEITDLDGKFSTNSLHVGASGVGYANVGSPSGLLSNSGVKRFSCWYRVDGVNDPAPLLSISFADGGYILITKGALTLWTEISSTNNGGFIEFGESGVIGYQNLGEWHHLQCVLNGDTFKLAMDGTELFSLTQASNYDLWPGNAGNAITEVLIGAFPTAWNNTSAYFNGYIDVVEFLEGDTSWLGGSYTVPTAEPDDYGTAGLPDLNANGANTLEEITSIGFTAMPERTADGANTLEDITSEGIGGSVLDANGANTLDPLTSDGTGVVQNAVQADGSNTLEELASLGNGNVVTPLMASGANTLDDFGSFGVAGTTDDVYVSLALNGYVSSGVLWDSSIYRNHPTPGGFWPTVAGSSIFVGNAVEFGDGDYCDAPLNNGLLSTQSDKCFDLFFEGGAGPSGRTIFFVQFETGDPYYVPSIGMYVENNQLWVEAQAGSLSVVQNYGDLIGTNHLRLAAIGNSLYVCKNGTQLGVHTGAGPVWPAFPVKRFKIGHGSTATHRMDAFTVREGNIGYSGGNYTVPTSEWYPSAALLYGANTLESFTGTGFIDKPMPAIGANTLDPITSTGTATSGLQVNGANTLDDVTHVVTEGFVGVYRSGTAANTLEPITSEATGEAPPTREATQDTTVSVDSVASALVYYRGVGANTIEPITSVAAMDQFLGAYGANTVTVDSDGYVPLPAWANGANVLKDFKSSASATLLVSGSGESSFSITAVGTISLPSPVVHGANTVDEIYGAGSISSYFPAQGFNAVEISSAASANVLVSASGQNVLEDVFGERHQKPTAQASVVVPNVPTFLFSKQQNVSVFHAR